MPSAPHDDRNLPDLSGSGLMWLLRVVNVVAFVYILWAAFMYPPWLVALMLLMPVAVVGATFLPAGHSGARYAIWLVAAYNAVVGVGLLVTTVLILGEPGSPVAIGITLGMFMLPAAVVGPVNAVALAVHLCRRRSVRRPDSDLRRKEIQPSPAIDPQGLVSGIRLGPIVLGVVVDWALTILAGIALTLIFIDPAVWEVEYEEFDAVYDAAFDAMFLDTQFLLTFLLLGMLATATGAYVGARRAATLELKYGLVIAVTSGLIGLLLYLLPVDGTSLQTPVWYEVMSWIFLIPAGVLGGYLAKRRARARRRRET